MNMRIRTAIFTLLLITGTCSSELLAQKERELPKTGTLSGTYMGGNEGVAVPGQWGEKDILSDKQPPITGSVSQRNREEWIMKVFNNTIDDYSVGVKVIQFDKRGNKTKSDNFSYRLKAGESKERSIRARSNTETAELELTNWKQLTDRGAAAEESK